MTKYELDSVEEVKAFAPFMIVGVRLTLHV